jgi:hypothetical protein
MRPDSFSGFRNSGPRARERRIFVSPGESGCATCLRHQPELRRNSGYEAARTSMNPDKPVHADNVPTDKPRQPFPHEQVAARAEKLWHDRNCPTGQDEAIWLEAESQLLAEAETRPVAGTPSRPYVDEPARQVSDRTKVQDPTGSAVQTRSETKPPKSKRSKQIRTQ